VALGGPAQGQEQAPPPPDQGQEAPPTQPEPVPSPAVPVPQPQRQLSPDQVFSGRPVPEDEEDRNAEHSWFDSGRSFVGRLFFAPAVRLDRFFSDETDLDPRRAESFARLRGGVFLSQDGKPDWTTDLLLDLRFPGFDRWLGRFRLILSGASDTPVDSLGNQVTASSPFTFRRGDPANLELRYGAYQGIRSSVDLGAGILFRLPPGAFTRARYRVAIPIDKVLVARLAYQVFWRTDYLLGTRANGALEWPIGPTSLLRLGGASQVAMRKTKGIEYDMGLEYLRAFTPTFAVSAGSDAQGAERSPVAIDKYRVFTRLRRDVLRRWLFVEVEPELGWPWREDRGRYRNYAVTLRLEVQFEGEPGGGGP
jgi:hypothetical protein